MKPESRSRVALSVTQSKAKMYEYNVPLEEHIVLRADPTALFPLTIGILGDIAARINDGDATIEEIHALRESLPFSARFFDAFIETKLNVNGDPYIRLLGSAAYFLCDLPGNSKLLAKAMGNDVLILDAFGMENLLIWILRKNFDKAIELPVSLFRESLAGIYQYLQQYDQTGIDEKMIIEQCDALRKLVYEFGTPYQLLLGDLIGAVTRMWLQRSVWATIPNFSGLNREKWAPVFQKRTFIRDLWPAQIRLGDQGIFLGKSAIIQMPTSAGKTKAAEIIVRSAFLAERITLAVIVAPFRALCHEIKDTLVDAFRGDAIFIDELSDNLQVDFSAERFLIDNQILIVTPEKLNYVLRHSPELANKIGLLIYDEGHQFDNDRRGITYELLLTSLKKKISPQAQTILISAVISNAEQIGTWLLGEGFETVYGNDLLPTFRSIAFTSWTDRRGQLKFVNPLNIDESEFFVPRIIEQFELNRKPRERRDRVFPERTEGNQISLYLGLRLIPNGSVAIFCGQKASVSSICEKAVDIFERGIPLLAPINNGNDVAEIEKLSTLHVQNLGEISVFTRSARLGIFAHHNNIPHGIRLAVEYAIKEGLVGFVVCTSTLAQGVNLPIRYLFVTSTYQGGDEIKVRDFQNLIGRSGRADRHTEGSIIFADPKIIDQHGNGDDFYWNKAKRLLQENNSEPCASTLFSIFKPLMSNDDRYSYNLDPFSLVKAYNEGTNANEELISEIVAQHADYRFTLSNLSGQIRYRTYLMGAIESYLMANWDETHPEFNEEAVTDLAKGTLAYFLSNEDQKEQIIELFRMLARNIAEKVPVVKTRIIFGKTLFGLQDAVTISNWVNENITQLVSVSTDQDMLQVLWPLISTNISTLSFRNCDRPDLLLVVARSWLSGESFAATWGILASADARTITQSRKYKVEDIVDICENGFGYDGMLVLGAVIELIQTIDMEAIEDLTKLLVNFQRKFKYGLPSLIQVVLYELGFSDRVVSIELSTLFQDVNPNRESVIRALQAQPDAVFAILNKYPTYFSQIYKNVAA